jgi:glucose/arabinose dehydrogenase
MFTQSGWTARTTGSPALNGGNNNGATTSFDGMRVDGVAASSSQPFRLGGDPVVHPADFRVTTFASGLSFPHSMVPLADGSLLVGVSNPTGGNYFASTGQLVRLADADNDGVADGPPTVLYDGLPGTITAVKASGSLLFVTSAGQQIAIFRMGATPSSPPSLLGTLTFTFPAGWVHTTYALETRPTPGQSGSIDLFFNVGSQFNNAVDTGTVTLGGLSSGTLQGSSIYMVTVQDTGGTPTVSDPIRIASGLRNAAGLAIQPTTGDLYFEDNGIDSPSFPDEPLSADELNRIAAADIGVRVPDFGFPRDYIEYRTGRHVGSGATQPVVAFQPTPDPSVGSESEGPSEIAFAPASFPAGLNNGVVVGFHGRFDLSGKLNEENPLVYYDLATGHYFDLIGNDEPNIGHLDSVLSTADSLFLGDLGTGSLFGPNATGAIYQIEVRP